MSLYQLSFLKPDSRKIFNNILWLFFDKGLRMGLGLVIGIWIARYLGPAQFGKLNYGQAFIAIFSTIVNLGLDTTLVKEIVNKPAIKGRLIGTSFYLRFYCAITAIFLAIITAYYFEHEQDRLSFQIIIVLSIGLIFQPMDVVELYLQAQLKSKITVIIKNTSYIITSGLRVFLLIFEFPLIFFAIATVAELALAALIVAVYSNKKLPIKFNSWNWDTTIAKKLLVTSWPLILSALAVILYMRMDQIMLKSLQGSFAVGNYSAAVRITEILFFIPVIISNSLFPSLVNISNNLQVYHRSLTRLYSILIYLSFVMSVCIMFLSPSIISFLYGEQFKDAASVLNIHVWSSIFVFIGVASSHQLVIEGKTKITLYRTLIGVITNFTLNIFFIPIYGVQGAAIATLISYATSSFLSNFLFKSTRKINYLYFRSIFFFKKINRI